MGSRNRFKYSKNKNRNSSGQVIKTVPSTTRRQHGRSAAKKRIEEKKKQEAVKEQTKLTGPCDVDKVMGLNRL